jgi:hypothetical protein
MRTWIAKWPSDSFYVLTLTLSWGYWLALLAQGQHVERLRRGPAASVRRLHPKHCAVTNVIGLWDWVRASSAMKISTASEILVVFLSATMLAHLGDR